MTALMSRLAQNGPARWAVSRPWMKSWLHELGIRPLSHSSLIWLREGSGHHTRVTFRNYLSLNYGIDRPEYHFRLNDGDGVCVASWRRVARPDETLIVESPELVARF